MFRFLLSFCVCSATILAAAPQPQRFRHPLVFEPNHGQAPARVKWIARASGYQLLLTAEGPTILVPQSASRKAKYSPVRMRLTGSRPWHDIKGLMATGGVSNYLLGNDPRQWHTGIPHYAKLSATGVYDGIDLVFYSNGEDLEYDFVVAPGADPEQIRLAFDGLDGMRVDGKSGDLILTAGQSEIRHVRPKVYQQIGNQRVEVAGGYQILDRRQATFTLAAYDRRRPLVIDPTVKFSIVLPGSGSDFPSAMALDRFGNAYITGGTSSTDFPLDGAYQADQPDSDAFVVKFASGGGLMFSTYLGGAAQDGATGIAVDSTGVYVTGVTFSSNFPIKNLLFPKRGDDGFVTKLNPAGNDLIYSGYLGGSGDDEPTAIAVDAANAAWVVGRTNSQDFPIAGGSAGGQQRIYGGGAFDAFLAKIAPSGTAVAFSTYAGGPSGDAAHDVAIDRTGSVYAVGSAGPGFPITPGMKNCGTLNAFALRLKGTGTQAKYATCLGQGLALGIAVNSNFNAFVTGETFGNFPTTNGAFQGSISPQASTSAFATRLNAAGAVVYSTYLAGSDYHTIGAEIAVDGNTAYVAGQTNSTRFPGVSTVMSTDWHGFVSKLTPQGNALTYTMIQGSAIYGVAVFQIGRLPGFNPLQIYAAGYLEEPNTFNPNVLFTKWEESGGIVR